MKAIPQEALHVVWKVMKNWEKKAEPPEELGIAKQTNLTKENKITKKEGKLYLKAKDTTDLGIQYMVESVVYSVVHE